MNRMFASAGLALVLLATPVGPSTVAAATPQGAITWTVDHVKKTITVAVRLQIYSGCSGDPIGGDEGRASACRRPGSELAGQTKFLADKIKAQIEAVWNKPYRFRCYELVFTVDIKVGTDRSHVDADRLGVRIDPSPAGIRDYVNAPGDKSKWNSDSPADKLTPGNDGAYETTWGEASALRGIRVYAHEFGHILGLHDAYHDVVDSTGVTTSVPYPDAPLDLMSIGSSTISKETTDRLVKRNLPVMKDTHGKPVTDSDLACDYKGDWAGRKLVGTLEYCGSTKTPYWGADIKAANGDKAFVAYDIPQGSEQPVVADIITRFVDPELDELLAGTGRFVPGDPPHFLLDNAEGSYIITLQLGKFCDLPPQ